MCQALEIGIAIDEFWDLTPREFWLHAEAAARRARDLLRREMAVAWNMAALVRTQDFPALEEFLAPAEESRETPEQEHARREREHRELLESRSAAAKPLSSFRKDG